uniref:Protein PHLOEM PROTEIN 2-LIKE A9-like n=1 Tax=Lotus japonicus TaxID=34305 RepID=I3SWZ9_LOTJA|nr:unknown [Lotus japonicus]
MPFKKPHHTSDPSCIKPDDNGGYIIEPRGLNIVWGNDDRYWKVTNQGPAELIQVSWLEVTGLVNVQKNKTYSVTFDVKVKEDGYGWKGTDVLVMAKLGKNGKYLYETANLTPGEKLTVPPRPGGLEIKVDSNTTETQLHFGLYEVWSGKWKGGLEIIKARVIAMP